MSTTFRLVLCCGLFSSLPQGYISAVLWVRECLITKVCCIVTSNCTAVWHLCAPHTHNALISAVYSLNLIVFNCQYLTTSCYQAMQWLHNVIHWGQCCAGCSSLLLRPFFFSSLSSFSVVLEEEELVSRLSECRHCLPRRTEGREVSEWAWDLEFWMLKTYQLWVSFSWGTLTPPPLST